MIRKNTKNQSIKPLLHIIVLIFAIGIIVVKVIVPLASTNFYQQDAVGHYFFVWFIKAHLFPHLIGWNPFFYSGTVQNQYYPGLFHYLAAILSFTIPIDKAMKFLLSISCARSQRGFPFDDRNNKPARNGLPRF